MKLTVERVTETGKRELVATTTSERKAQQIAEREAIVGGQVYITWYRDSDGQQGYLNRDGHSPVGRAY